MLMSMSRFTTTSIARAISGFEPVPIPIDDPSLDNDVLYGYVPTRWICILFVVLFGTTTFIHAAQALLYKRPRLLWLFPTIILCGTGDLIGWIARLESSHHPQSLSFFQIQIATTIISPTFLTAGLYTVLGRIINQLGSQYSRLPPRAYLITFLTADIFALIVQAVGGGNASLAFQEGRSANPGGHIMLGGIVLQLVGILCYSALATEFFLRYHYQKPLRPKPPPLIPTSKDMFLETDTAEKALSASSPPLAPPSEPFGGVLALPRGMLIVISGMALATLFVLIRTGYRTVELINGWGGRIITTERYFNYLDGAPICLALFTLNILHPSYVY